MQIGIQMTRTQSPKDGELDGICKLWRFAVAKAGIEVAPPNPLLDHMMGIPTPPSRPF